MHIESIGVSMPARQVDNEQIIDLVRQQSRDSFVGDLDQALGRINKLLSLSGARSRRWLDEGEKPIDHICAAVERARGDAAVDKHQVDLLIYVGIGKGFMEPGQAYMVAHALGMDQVECFDLTDACMSWTRALQVSESLLKTERYQRILVVNGEFNTIEGGPLWPCNYRLENLEQLRWTFASYTIGSAATATLLSAESEAPWTWRFLSQPKLADLCTVPGFGLGSYSAESESTGKNGALRFTSFGKALHTHAHGPCIRLMNEVMELHPDISRVFPHASSYTEWERFAIDAGVQDKMLYVYPDYGNLVSASVPANLALAWQDGAVQRGDRLAGWVGSAGMSFAAYSFVL